MNKKHIHCLYPNPSCVISEVFHPCCRDCLLDEQCRKRCLNSPDKCGSPLRYAGPDKLEFLMRKEHPDLLEGFARPAACGQAKA